MLSFPLTFHKDPKVLHKNLTAPHAYMIPYHSDAAAIAGIRGQSRAFYSLCGDWDFRFYSKAQDIDDFLSPAFSRAEMEKLSVPMCWQCETDRGYDVPNYTNINYPFPVDPPHLPTVNPCGLYVRDFYMRDEELLGKAAQLHFEGVSSCLYVWVNDAFVGYSQVSHVTAEFDISAFVRGGKNTMVTCLTNGGDSYFPTSEAYDEGGYEARTSRLKKGGDEIIVEGMTRLFGDLK